ncbi:MAG: metallophosphoesterase, partial [Cyanobacteria bacterium P01_G01_bin.4]
MGWQRFLTGVILGTICSVLLACTEAAMQAPSSSIPDVAAIEQTDATAPVSADVAPETPAELPAETEQLLASLDPALTDPPRGDLRMVVMSDLNGVYGSTDYDPDIDKTMALIPFWNPDLVLCSGDMVAGQDLTLTPDQINAMWSAFDDHVAAPLRTAGLPY